jgi:hypothetical protein
MSSVVVSSTRIARERLDGNAEMVSRFAIFTTVK